MTDEIEELPSLTPRQLELVVCLANGMRVEQISSSMHLSKSSVMRTLARARQRVHASTNSHLVAIAIASELLVFDPHGEAHIPK